MSEEQVDYNVPHRPISILQAQLIKSMNAFQQTRKENDRLRYEIQLLEDEINGLLACCSLEKKVDYKLNEWLNTSYTGSEELDRKAFSIQLVDFMRKELQ